MPEHADKTRALFSAFSSAVAASTEKAAVITKMQQRALDNATASRDFAERLRPALGGQVNAVLGLDDDMREKKKRLLALIDEQRDRITHMDSQFSTEEMVEMAKAFAMLAAAPSQGPEGIDTAKESLKTIGGTVYQVVKDPQILDDTGEPVKKKLLIGKLIALQGGTAGLLEAYRASIVDDHVAEIDDSNATKRIASKDEILELIGQFNNALGKSAVDNVKVAFESYVGESIHWWVVYPWIAY